MTASRRRVLTHSAGSSVAGRSTQLAGVGVAGVGQLADRGIRDGVEEPRIRAAAVGIGEGVGELAAVRRPGQALEERAAGNRSPEADRLADLAASRLGRDRIDRRRRASLTRVTSDLVHTRLSPTAAMEASHAPSGESSAAIGSPAAAVGRPRRSVQPVSPSRDHVSDCWLSAASPGRRRGTCRARATARLSGVEARRSASLRRAASGAGRDRWLGVGRGKGRDRRRARSGAASKLGVGEAWPTGGSDRRAVEHDEGEERAGDGGQRAADAPRRSSTACATTERCARTRCRRGRARRGRAAARRGAAPATIRRWSAKAASVARHCVAGVEVARRGGGARRAVRSPWRATR